MVEVGEYKVNVTAGIGPAVVMIHGEERQPSWKDWEGFLGLADSYRLHHSRPRRVRQVFTP